MWRYLLIVLCMAASRRAASDVTIDRVVVHGNREFSSAEHEALLNLPRRTNGFDDSLAARHQAWQDSMMARDYLFARIDSVQVKQRRGRSVRHVYVHEGSLARVSLIRWLGDSLRVSAEVRDRRQVIPGAAFHWADLAYDVECLLEYFVNAGYPFAKVDLQKLEADSSQETVDVWLKINSGPFTRLDFVSFSGNRHTRETFLIRETRLRLGAPFDQRRVDAAQRHLRRLDLLRRVSPAQLVVNEMGQSGVRFDVEEARTAQIDVVAGYQPETKSQKAAVSGLVNLEFLNLFGAGRRARLHWERPERRIQAVDVSYREPWIMRQPVAARFDFAQRIEDTLYVTRRFGLRVEADLAAAFGVWGTLQREAVIADSASAAALGLPDSRTTYVESGFAFDSRDHRTNPRRGVLFSTFAGTGWRKRVRVPSGGVGGNFRQQRGGVDSEIAQEVFPFWILAAGMHARFVESTEPEILSPDLYRLGGARTLRGYREEQFVGSRIGWASAEVRYWLGPASRFFVFTDAGSAHRERRIGEQKNRTTMVRFGTGVGVRLETNLGIWGIDYGIGEDDRVLNGKLHVSLQSSF